ncbi:MAG: CBS domain-containing protein [Anaerolineae bacterium]|nr:CBS domain-containing protein [Thermoflexus sp.]MDW8065065.1 CBS domain-containing protein [Anaerolineae bacterium]
MLVARDIMTPNPVVVRPDDPLGVAVEKMRSRRCRRLPVVEGDRLVGMITDRDVRLALNSPLVLHERRSDQLLLEHVPVRACMTPDPISVSPDTPVVEVVRLMRDHKFGGVPVVEEGHLVGIITETDLMELLIRLLEYGIDETRWVQMRRHGNRQALSVHAHERS